MGKKLAVFFLVLFFAVCIAVFLGMVPGLLALMDVYQLAFWTSIFVFVLLNVIYLFMRAFGMRNKNTGSILMSFAASLFLYGGFFLFIMSVPKLGINSSISMVLLAPLLFLILVPIFTKESISIAQILGVIAIAAGGACIAYALGFVQPSSWESVGYIVGAAVCWALFSFLAMKTKTAIFVNVYIYSLVGVIIAIPLMFLQSSFILPAYNDVWTLLIFGVLTMTVIFLWGGTFKYSSASYWGAMVFMIPSVLLLYNMIINSAALSGIGIIGFSITGLAVIYRMAIKM